MIRVPTVSSADPDGTAYAKPVAFGLNQTGPTPTGPVVAKIAAYTITKGEVGGAFSNSGAGGSVTLTLPTPWAGALLWIFKITTGQNVVAAAEAASTIDGAASLTNSTSEVGMLLLIGTSATTWQTLRKGTWA